MHIQWLSKDIVPIVCAVVVAAMLAKGIVSWSPTRWVLGLELVLLGSITTPG
jgi:hypothetical protein